MIAFINNKLKKYSLFLSAILIASAIVAIVFKYKNPANITAINENNIANIPFPNVN